VFGVVEQAAGQRIDQPFLGFEGVGRHRIGLDPVAVVEDALLAVEQAARAFGRLVFLVQLAIQCVHVDHGRIITKGRAGLRNRDSA
jgi:hypothetical protein